MTLRLTPIISITSITHTSPSSSDLGTFSRGETVYHKAMASAPAKLATYGGISSDDLLSFQGAFESDPRYRQAMNAVCTAPVNQVSLNRRKSALVEHSFSV